MFRVRVGVRVRVRFRVHVRAGVRVRGKAWPVAGLAWLPVRVRVRYSGAAVCT